MRVIKVLDLGGIQTLLDWAAAERWNPGLRDAQAFQAADPDGFLGAFVDGVMVAAIAAVAYDEKFGFIGLYICHPDWRGQGHGRAVWDAGMAHLGTRTVGLDGVPEQQSNYASMGFVAAYQTVRMSGTLRAAPSLATPVDSMDGIRGMDIFPAERDGFLAQWIAAPNRAWRTKAGFGVVRACTEGQKVGPLFAADAADAMELWGRSRARCRSMCRPGRRISLVAWRRWVLCRASGQHGCIADRRRKWTWTGCSGFRAWS